MRLGLLAALALLGALAFLAARAARASAQELPRPTPAGFVRVDGTRFIVGDEELVFVGANVAVMHGRAHRDALESTLDAAAADGLRVVRLWALGERPEGAPDWARDYAFRVGEEGWVEPSFEHLDRALEAAAARGLRVIVVLANRWRDYGGLPQYLRWAGIPFDESLPGAPSELELVPFWSSERAEALYREHVRRVVGRTNARTGIAYRDDPTIFSWELVNEASVPARGTEALAAWVERNARWVHELDPNHLVGAGHIGYERASERESWLRVQSVPGIDYADAHAYPAAYDRVRDLRALERYVDDRARLAREVLRRPFVWGEFGFSTADPRLLGVPRARWFDTFLRASRRSGASGALAWIYAPASDRPDPHAIVADAPVSRDVRAVLRRQARRWLAPPPTPRPAPRPPWQAVREIRGPARVHDGWSADGTLRIPVEGFVVARFEAVGREETGAVAHLWGTGRGSVRYRFRAPPGPPPLRLRLAMHASSELPGTGAGRTVEDGGRARVLVDGVAVGSLELPPDDGVGRRVEIAVEDGPLLARLFARARARHELTLEVEPGVGAEGLCLYGGATGREDLAPEVLAELPGALTLGWER